MTGKKKGRGKKPKGTTSNESSPAKSLTPGGSAHNTPLKRVSEEGSSTTPVKIRSPGPKSKTMAAETTPVKTRSPGPKSKTMPVDNTPVKCTTAAIAAILDKAASAKKGTTTPVKSVESAEVEEPEPEPATPDTAADESASSKEPTPVKSPKPSPKVAKVMPLPSTSSSSDSDTDEGIVNDAESVIVSESEAGSAKKKPNKSPKVTPLKVKLKVSGPPAKKKLDLRMPSYLGPRKEPSTAGATQIDIASSPSLLLAATRAGRKSAGTLSSPKTPKTPKSATKRSTPGGSPSTPTTGSSKAGPSGAKRTKTSKTTWYSRTRKEPPKSATFIDDDSDDDFIGPTPEIERPKTVAVPSTDDSSDSEGEIIVDPKNMEPTQAEAR